MEEEIFHDDSIFVEAIDDLDSFHSTSLMEDSFSSFVGGEMASTSTPVRRSGDRGLGARPISRVQPPITPRLKCPHCPNSYANEHTLAVHIKMHTMKGAFACLPTLEELHEAAKALLEECLKEVIAEEPLSDLGRDLQSYASMWQQSLVSSVDDDALIFVVEEFHKILKSQNALMPSGIRSAIYRQVNKLLNCDEFISTLKKHLIAGTDSVRNVFIGNLMLKLSNKILVFVLRKMKSRNEELSDPKQTHAHSKEYGDRADSDDFKEIVFFISGSVINGLINKGEKYNSETWKTYVSIIKTKFVATQSVSSQCSERISRFTANVNRGGLTFCNQEASCFFVKLFDKLMCLEDAKGGVLLDVAEEEVSKDNIILFLWDDIIGSELSEEESLDLLLRITRICCKIVSKGILKRRLNEQLKKAYSSVALRSKLSR